MHITKSGIPSILLSKDFIIFLIIANIFFTLSNVPLYILNSKTPPGTVFPLFQPSQIPDFNGYLSGITLGQNGYWYFRNPYTSEKPIPSIFYFYYLLIGKISGFLHLWQPVAFHLFRIITVELFFLGIYFLAKYYFSTHTAFWASIVSLLITIPPPFFFASPYLTDSWWSKFDAIQRLDSIPHHLTGQMLLLFGLGLYLRQKLIPSLILIFIAGLIFPPVLFPIIFALPFTLLFLTFKHISLKQIFSFTPLFLSAVFAIVIALIQINQGYHKSVWIDWEIARWNHNEPDFNKNLLTMFLLFPIFTFPAVAKHLKATNWQNIFLVFWGYLPIILLPIVDIISISKIRLLGVSSFIPLGILTSQSLSILFNLKSKRLFFYLILLLFSLNILTTSSLILLANINVAKSFPIYNNIFIPHSTWKLINFVKANLAIDSIILSDEYLGNLLPSYAPVISYFGHINLTYNFKQKQNYVWRFYTLRMNDEEALRFLKSNKIKYVYLGINEKGLGSVTSLPFKFLKPIYNQDNEILYQVEEL